MVGLPARGKSFTAQRLARYLQWMSMGVGIFNVGNYRRRLQQELQNGSLDGQDFFDPANTTAMLIREQAAQQALDDCLHFIIASDASSPTVAIYDATNSTRKRRRWLYEHLHSRGNVFFVELVCTDTDTIRQNILASKTCNPDYSDSEVEEVLLDFSRRIQHYQSVYETLHSISEPELSFARIVDFGRDWEMQFRGRPSVHLCKIIRFLHETTSAASLIPKRIWLTRHGESEMNLQGRIGGSGAALSSRGREFALKLAKRLPEILQYKLPSLTVWTSSLARTRETAQILADKQNLLSIDAIPWRALDELSAGLCDGMTYEEIDRAYPHLSAKRAQDKFGTRYPQGESYADLVVRLHPLIMEVERSLHRELLIVAHQAIVRCLYAYFTGMPMTSAAHIEVPLHSLVGIDLNCKATSTATKTKTSSIDLVQIPVPAVSTQWRPPNKIE